MYKKLLDDAQMQHFELSKQSRILLAEKEAELICWKNLAEQSGQGVSKEVIPSCLQLEKLVQEKVALEKTLEEVGKSLETSLQERNTYHVLKGNYDEVLTRYEALKREFISWKADSEVREKSKSETIDNLVAEYSLLAAEADLINSQSAKRVNEVLQENEVLVTKMHALEHSITELADRTASSSLPAFQAAQGTISLSSASTDSSSTSHSTVTAHSNNSLLLDLKEARSKLVSAQMDLKEKESEIAKLKLELSNVQTIHPPQIPEDSAAVIATTKELARLAEEQSKLNDEADKLRRDLATRNKEVTDLEEERAHLKEEVITLNSKLEQTQTELNSLKYALNAKATEDASAATLTLELARKDESIASLKDLNDSLSKSLVDFKIQIKAREDNIVQLQESLRAAEHRVAMTESRLQAEKDEFEKRLEAALGAEKNFATQLLLKKEDELKRALVEAETQISELKSASIALEKSHISALQRIEDEQAVKLRTSTEKLKKEFEQSRVELTEELTSQAKSDLAKELEALRQELSASAKIKENQLRAEFEIALNKAVADTTAAAEKNRLLALEQLEAECNRARELALQQLEKSKNDEVSHKLTALSNEKAQELAAALNEAEQLAQRRIENLQKESDAKIAEANRQMAQIQADLTNVEAR